MVTPFWQQQAVAGASTAPIRLESLAAGGSAQPYLRVLNCMIGRPP